MSGTICLTVRNVALDRDITLERDLASDLGRKILSQAMEGKVELGTWERDVKDGKGNIRNDVLRKKAIMRGEVEGTIVEYPIDIILSRMGDRYRIGIPEAEGTRSYKDSSFEGTRERSAIIDRVVLSKVCDVEQLLLSRDLLQAWYGDRAVVSVDVEEFSDTRIKIARTEGTQGHRPARDNVIYTAAELCAAG
jgi:hypothetical protein